MTDLSEALEQPINKPSYWPSETGEDYDERAQCHPLTLELEEHLPR